MPYVNKVGNPRAVICSLCREPRRKAGPLVLCRNCDVPEIDQMREAGML